MATSGSTETTVREVSGQRAVWIRLSWQQLSQDVTNNRTTIRLTLQVVTGAYGAMYGTASKAWNIQCNGTTNGTWSIQQGANATKTLGTRDVTINHNADGTGSFNASAYVTFDMNFNGWVGTWGIYLSGTLNTIPRASQPSCITWPNTTTDIGDMGSTITIHMNRASSSFTHTVKYSFQGLTGTIASNVGDNCSWTIPTSFADKLPNATSGSGTITVDTYSGGTKIGTKSVSFTTRVPGSYMPSISNVAVSDTKSLAGTYGGYVVGKSQVRAVVTAAGSHGSTIKNYSITMGSVVGSSATSDLGAPLTAGTISVVTTVTDTRNRKVTKTVNITALAYDLPNLNGTTAIRTPNDESTTVRVTVKGATTSLSSKNTATVKIERRQSGTTAWTQVNSADRGVSWSFNYDITGLSAEQAWEIRVTATDKLGESISTTLEVPTASPVLDFRSTGKGLGIGAVSNLDNCLEIGWTTRFGDLAELMNGVMGFSVTSYSTSAVWYEIARSTMPYNSDRSCGYVRVFGRIGGYEEGSSSQLDVYIPFRGFNGAASCSIVTLDPSVDLGKTDLEIYVDSGGYVHVWLKCNGYYSFDVLVQGLQMTTPNAESGTTPTGTRKCGLGDMTVGIRNPMDIASHVYLRNNIALASKTTANAIVALLRMNTSNKVELNWTQGGLGGRVRKKLWSGTWSSGNITVSEAPYYNAFLFKFNKGYGCALVTRQKDGSNGFSGVGGEHNGSAWIFTISVTINGTTLSSLNARYMPVNNGGNQETCAVTEIYGLL